MSDELKPLKNCPFCASDKVDLLTGGMAERHYSGRCRHCHAVGPTEQTEAKAIKVWNTRHTPEAVKGVVDKSEELLAPDSGYI